MEYYYKHWKDAGRTWNKIFEGNWSNFSIKEIAQRGPGHEKGNTPVVIMPDTIDRLQLLRNYCGFPLLITSAYRSPEYNDKVSGTGRDGPHTTGRAFDINIFGGDVTTLIYFAHKVGFTGFGEKQHGPYADRMVHIDDLLDHETEGPRPWNWTYP